MIHGYHVVMGLYGFWLPNDPRGSWSDFVGAWELLRFGRTTKKFERTTKLSDAEKQLRAEAKRHLKYPPVELTGRQALAVAKGFANYCRTSCATIWACSILPEHVHLVIARHRYKIERVANLLKGAATKQLRVEGLDPMAAHTAPGRPIRGPWARRQWNVYLDSEQAINNAIRYVEQNPLKDGKVRQHWSFLTPFAGVDDSGMVQYL